MPKHRDERAEGGADAHTDWERETHADEVDARAEEKVGEAPNEAEGEDHEDGCRARMRVDRYQMRHRNEGDAPVHDQHRHDGIDEPGVLKTPARSFLERDCVAA